MDLTASDSPIVVNVGVSQMMEVFTNSNQNTNSSDHVQTKNLPTFEKLLLCSVIVCMRGSKKRVCTRAKVSEMFFFIISRYLYFILLFALFQLARFSFVI